MMNTYIYSINIYIYFFNILYTILYVGVPVCTPTGKNLANANSRRLLIVFWGKGSPSSQAFL